MVSATLLNSFKIRDVTLASLSSQLQNFNFCNFFFKMSKTTLPPANAGYSYTLTPLTPYIIVYWYLRFRQHPFF